MTQDADFTERMLAQEPPPLVVHVRTGNRHVTNVVLTRLPSSRSMAPSIGGGVPRSLSKFEEPGASVYTDPMPGPAESEQRSGESPFDMTPILQDLVEWGGCEISDLKQKWGEWIFAALRRKKYVEAFPTMYGETVILSRTGRRAVGLTNEYYPSLASLINNVALRRAVRSLELEGYSNPLPKFYGKAHAQMTSPQGEKVCVVARASGFELRSIELLAERLFSEQHQDLTKLIVFMPKLRKRKESMQRFNIEFRVTPRPAPPKVVKRTRRTKASGES